MIKLALARFQFTRRVLLIDLPLKCNKQRFRMRLSKWIQFATFLCGALRILACVSTISKIINHEISFGHSSRRDSIEIEVSFPFFNGIFHFNYFQNVFIRIYYLNRANSFQRSHFIYQTSIDIDKIQTEWLSYKRILSLAVAIIYIYIKLPICLRF